MSTEQSEAHTPCWTSLSSSYSRTKMGKCIDGIYHGDSNVILFTKYSHFFVVTSTVSASEVDTLFFKDIFRLHGLPKIIISDRDSKFTSAFWQALFDMVGTSMNMRTSYHPQTDGKTERVNQWMEGYLCNYVMGHQGAWETWLHLGEFCYNTTLHLSIRLAPFMALYGY